MVSTAVTTSVFVDETYIQRRVHVLVVGPVRHASASKELASLRCRAILFEFALQRLGLATNFAEALGDPLLHLDFGFVSLDPGRKVLVHDLLLDSFEDVLGALKCFCMDDIDQFGLHQPADDRIQVSGALDQRASLLDRVRIPVDAIRLGPKIIVTLNMGHLLVRLLNLFLVRGNQIRYPCLARKKKVLHDILCRGAEGAVDHLKDLSRAN